MNSIVKFHKLITWTIVTLIAYLIATTIQIHSDESFSIAQLFASPRSITLIGLMQTILLWNRQQLRSIWLKRLAIQLAMAIALQVLIGLTGWFSAVMAIATLGKSGAWSSFAESSTIVLLLFGIVSHGVIQGWGLRQAYRDCQTISLSSRSLSHSH